MKNSNKDLEAAVIGACLLDRNAYPVALSIIDDRKDTFSVYAYEKAWEAMYKLQATGAPIDLITVVEKLKAEPRFTPDDIVKLTEATTTVSSGANVEHHSAVLVQLRVMRDLQTVAAKITHAANDPTLDAFEALDFAEREVLNVGAVRTNQVADASKGIAEFMDQLERVRASPDGLMGMPTGLTRLDKRIKGLVKQSLRIIAARPGMGKTAFVLNQMRVNAHAGIPSLIFSLEMSRRELVSRLVIMESGINNDALTDPKGLSKEQMRLLSEASQTVASWPIYIHDEAGTSITAMRAITRRLKREKGIEYVAVDYIQLASGERERGGNREQEVSSITRGLKAMAKENDIPVDALSQLSRAVEMTSDKRPMLSHLRESGSIEQDADIVQFIFRPEYYEITADEHGNSTRGLAEIITAKNRNGQTGSDIVSCKLWLYRFEDEQEPTFAPALPAYSLNGITERPNTDDDLPF